MDPSKSGFLVVQQLFHNRSKTVIISYLDQLRHSTRIYQIFMHPTYPLRYRDHLFSSRIFTEILNLHSRLGDSAVPHYRRVKFLAYPHILIWRFPEIGLPPMLSIFDWDFPWNKPSNARLGVSPFMENLHIQVMLKRPICRPTGFVKSRENVGFQTSCYKKLQNKSGNLGVTKVIPCYPLVN